MLGRLKALAAWRETEARTKNLPRGRIIKDDTLNEIVLHPPKNQDDLGAAVTAPVVHEDDLDREPEAVEH